MAIMYVPNLQENKFTLYRLYRNKLGIPFEKDFNALAFFPDVERPVFYKLRKQCEIKGERRGVYVKA